MAEPVEAWWQRRQFSSGAEVPYPVGTYREAWQAYPTLIRQYHPEFNHGITLTQIPPAAEVLLLWECEVGHRFAATPEEQRSKPGTSRRRSTWCPDCASLAVHRATRAKRMPSPDVPTVGTPYSCGHPGLAPWTDPAADLRCMLCQLLEERAVNRSELLARVNPARRTALAEETSPKARYSWVCSAGHGTYSAKVESVLTGPRCPVCKNARAGAAAVPVGEAFSSTLAPKPASRAESELRQGIRDRLDVDLSVNAVRVAKPFFAHVEVWPDIPIAELKVAIEYDTIGRDGLEHLGKREEVDRRKDRRLRAAGWEVIRIRVGKLLPIGDYDIVAAGVSGVLIDRVIERLGEIRGELYVSAYRK